MHTKRCSHKKCQCFIVPTYILENLAQNDIEAARISLAKSRQIRKRRSLKEYDINGVVALTDAGAGPKGESARHVYDCNGGRDLRVKEVRKEGDRSIEDNAVNHAYDYAGIVRDYYKNVFHRNSIDDNGLDLILNVHFGHNYQNAFWDGDEMVFGDGDGTIFTSFTNSLDVIGHELTHGITQFTNGLEYDGQSGALNEHISDVFGIAIKQSYLKQTANDADWLIGADIMGPTLKGQALRSMKAPGTAFDNKLMGKDMQPDHMKNYYQGSQDNHGVHINSGIPNKVFYLVSMEIGTDKAALIWYNAMHSLFATTNFNQFAQIVNKAAQKLVDSGEVPQTAAKTVESAFKSVGLPS
ncbi:M4 family metallopeptidase [Bacillus cereus]|uniref:Neutral metalloproteinase n=1 Tax=Bacillus thuringiensis TaxID=1428 RepID=A0A9X5RPF6_BACTU|nr:MULTISPECIES: M4 family metallopeptidase [Bacillus]MCU5321382.1 M4 family metallopeptidase [Bacillus cereus]KAB7648061.1 M4 family metallopeptidase [Bacillus sp. B2-WWTP-C-10-Post-4]MCU5573198.1 M4 family metallopeptidase [Bacillus cereus]OFC86940.1 bacillolysin [Bacillus thuringiensis]PKS14252.1 M4 family peptidase [Bacillus sp. BI3]